ncbi:hypothetical protein [Streptomyces sp. NPDC126503]|uniref:Rv1733c family protein n=1 Tax=Streptomyces sp. NPDC126503 TaxID=3155315 RepID=UPI0033180A27
MRAATGLWRWRHNPLRRTTDLIEAWTALVALVLLCVAVPLAGWAAGSSAQASLDRTLRAQREQRLPTTARVVRPADRPAHGPGSGDGSSEQRARRPVVARWTAPDGSERTGTVTTVRGSTAPGDVLPIWTDRRGAPVAPPMRADTARAHAVIGGLMAAVLAGLAVEVARRTVVRGLTRLRFAKLDRAWAEAGPDWGRTGTGS